MKREDKKTEARNSIEVLNKEIVEAVKEGRPMLGKTGVLTPLLKQALEATLEGEMDAHLEDIGDEVSNRRNGKNRKQMRSDLGGFELEVPRDRTSSFEPEIIKKRQTILNESLD